MVLRESGFVKRLEEVYTVTQEQHLSDIMKYHKFSQVFLCVEVSDVYKVGELVLDMFKRKFTQRTDVDEACFEGNINDMVKMAFGVANAFAV